MHMADALLSPAVGGAMWAGTLGTIIYCAKKLKEKMDEKVIPLMGVLGAFIFAGQMINFTIPGTGSSGHIGGGMLLAILLGPYAAFLVIASVLVVQALFFADGGLLALGANIWNMGIYPCFIGYPLIYRAIVRQNMSHRRIMIASILSVVAGLQLGALSVVLETKLSGITELPFSTFVLLMQPIHLAIGLIEGFVTAGIVIYVRTLRPDIVEDLEGVKSLSPGVSLKKVLVAMAILAVITGGAFSWFASTYPDGLEWSIEKIYGKPEIPEKENPIKENISKLQEKTAIFPDYSFPSKGEEKEKPSWPAVDTGTSIAGLLGGIMVLGMVILIGFGIKVAKRSLKQKP
ncbi:MAG: cobalamin biosynthesis protein CbiM [Nitrospira sp.]|nr:cobalamin biosynthesis protein CbiM [Nitrospira sp.]